MYFAETIGWFYNGQSPITDLLYIFDDVFVEWQIIHA